ncbi:hypothetical protein ACHQM5_007493 [Ranunculus cassubicifolius]
MKQPISAAYAISTQVKQCFKSINWGRFYEKRQILSAPNPIRCHAIMVKLPHFANQFMRNSLLQLYSLRMEETSAEHVFRGDPNKPPNTWRCPYLSCKSCCAKAENPCPIHVLKQTGILAEKKPHLPSLFEKSADASPPGTSLRVSSLRQLNQFNGTQTPPRARSQRTRKEAAALNQWRFSKVKEYKERNVEVENEAFERYMQNIGLLEEAFFVHSPDDDDRPAPPAALGRDEIILEFKTRLRSHPRRSHNLKKRIQYIVDHGLSKLRKLDSNDYEVTDLECGKKTERVVAIDELIEKVNKVRNEEELVTCLNMKAQLFSPLEKDEASKEQSSVDAPMPVEPNYMLPRLWSKEEIDQKTLNAIDVHFSSLDQIEDL